MAQKTAGQGDGLEPVYKLVDGIKWFQKYFGWVPFFLSLAAAGLTGWWVFSARSVDPLKHPIYILVSLAFVVFAPLTIHLFFSTVDRKSSKGSPR